MLKIKKINSEIFDNKYLKGMHTNMVVPRPLTLWHSLKNNTTGTTAVYFIMCYKN